MNEDNTDRDLNPYRPPESDIKPDTDQTAVSDISGPSGVRGWLLFLCISLTILSPIATFINLFGGLAGFAGLAESGNSVVSSLVTLVLVDTVLGFGLMAFSIITGIGLWVRWKHAVRTAKVYLTVFLVYSIFAVFEPYIFGVDQSLAAAMVREIAVSSIRSGVYVAIWATYLTRSVRVKNTYSKDEDQRNPTDS